MPLNTKPTAGKCPNAEPIPKILPKKESIRSHYESALIKIICYVIFWLCGTGSFSTSKKLKLPMIESQNGRSVAEHYFSRKKLQWHFQAPHGRVTVADIFGQTSLTDRLCQTSVVHKYVY